MKNVAAVAMNTFREAVRDRVMYNLVFFALLMMGAAILVGQISIGIQETVIISLGLSAISFIGLLMAVFIGVGLVSKEMDKRTLYALLSKPVRRWEFLVGKFGGLVFTLAVNTAAMSLGLFAALLYVRQSLQRTDVGLLVAVYFVLLKLSIVVALALLFSCSTTSLLSILYSAGLYIAGSFVQQMRTLRDDQVGAATAAMMRWLSYVLPNFEDFSVTGSVAHEVAIPRALILENTLYAALYCAVVLMGATLVFSRRNLK
jgi:ABC-type transport system involved in multi-copper enzyme maturation permease subunit